MRKRADPSILCFIVFILSAQAFAQNTSPGFKSFKTVVIGEDARKLPGAIPADKKYQAVGIITCDKPNAKNTDGYVSTGTATLVENSQTLITAAHNFVNDKGELVTDIRKHCTFHVTNQNGQVLQTIKISDMISPNDKSTSNIDAPDKRQNDWAVIKLAEPVKDIIPFSIARQNIVNVNDPIKICSFSHDLQNYSAKRCLSGRYRNNGLDVSHIGNPLVLLHDMDTNGTSSGAPLFVERKGIPTVFGIHKGGKCNEGITEFNPNTCYNQGIFFNERVYKALDTIVEETGGSIYGPAKLQKTNFIRPTPANPNREVST